MPGLSTTPYNGSRDWYPQDMRLRNYVFNSWRQTVVKNGFEEYDVPLIEPLALYDAKSGDEIAQEQTFGFIDRGDRRMSIRPDTTLSANRMIANAIDVFDIPARWFNLSQVMRYERIQRGRNREFWQLSCDIFGQSGAETEAETINLGVKLLTNLGATPDTFLIRINNRKIVNFMMAQYLGLDAVQAQLMVKLFCNKNKISQEAFRDQAIEIFGEDFAEKGLRRIAHLLAAKSMADLPEDIRDSSAVREVQELFTELDALGIKNAVFDISLMRDLDYYNGTVYEFFDTHPENPRSIIGGGRYDGLTSLFGAKPIDAVGFSIGYDAVELFINTHKLMPKLRNQIDVYMIIIGDNWKKASKLAEQLRNEGVNIEIDNSGRKLDKQLKTPVDKLIPFIVFFGDIEAKDQHYTLKCTIDNKEEKLSFERLVSRVTDHRVGSSQDDDFGILDILI